MNFESQRKFQVFQELIRVPLPKIIRKHGTMRATLTHVGDGMDHVTDQLQATVLPADNIKRVSTKTSYPAPGVGFECGLSRLWSQSTPILLNFLSVTVTLRLFLTQQQRKKFST